MSIVTIISLAFAVFILAIIPGPGVFVTVSVALSRGFYRSTGVIAGIVLGDVIYLILAIFGLYQLTNVLGDVFNYVKYLGACYLFFLGCKLFTHHPSSARRVVKEGGSWWNEISLGLAITLCNPKVIFFYAGFLPLFVNISALALPDVVAIGLIVAVVLSGTLLGYAYLSSKIRHINTNSMIPGRIAGSLLIISSILLAIKA